MFFLSSSSRERAPPIISRFPAFYYCVEVCTGPRRLEPRWVSPLLLKAVAGCNPRQKGQTAHLAQLSIPYAV